MLPTGDSLGAVRAILSAGSFEQFIGLPEDDRLEFKSGVYALDADSGRHELAKDICGMLNAGRGGLIVLGVKTTKDMVRFADVVTEVSEFGAGLVNPEQVRSIAQGLIYPALPTIEIKWHESAQKPGRGLVAIDIPEPPPSSTPYLMVKALDDAGKLRGSLFGYFERKLTNVEVLSAQEMHLMLREGKRSGEVRRQYETILDVLNDMDRQRTVQAVGTRESRGLRFSQLQTDAQKAFGEETSTQIFLAADPQSLVELKDLFRSQDAEVVRTLENPDRLRSGGWDLNLDGDSEIVRGQLRRKARRNYKVLQVSREGTIMFLALGNERFLCWGSKQQGAGPLAINPIALAEVVYNFVVFCNKELALAEPAPVTVRFYLHLQNMSDDAGLATLRPDRVDPGALPMSATYTAPNAFFATDLERSFDEIAGRIAFDLVAELYVWFGISVARIPYARAEADGGIIDRSTILG